MFGLVRKWRLDEAQASIAYYRGQEKSFLDEISYYHNLANELRQGIFDGISADDRVKAAEDLTDRLRQERQQIDNALQDFLNSFKRI